MTQHTTILGNHRKVQNSEVPPRQGSIVARMQMT